MKFCPKCGMRLVLTQKQSDDEPCSVLTCSKCGYQQEITAGESTFSKVIERPSIESVTVVVGEDANLQTMPKTKIECPKCSNKEAFWWMVQTRGADESPTQFFRCTKCNYTWREMA